MDLPVATRRLAALAIAAAVLGLLCAMLAGHAGARAAAPAGAVHTRTSGVRAPAHAWARPATPAASAVRDSGGCPDTKLMPTPRDAARIMRATLCLVNAQRRRHGLVALVEDTRLDESAQAHSNDMVEHGYFEHVSPTGSTPVGRMTSTGYLSGDEGYVVGENIAWGTLNLATPASIVTAWMNSPDHRANILRAAFRQEGLGVNSGVPGDVGRGQPGATYTQDFGVITGG